MKSLEEYEQILKMYQDGYSINLISKILKISRQTLNSVISDPERALKKAKENLSLSCSKERLIDLVKESVSMAEIIRKLNFKESKNNYKILSNLFNEYNIDTTNLLGKAHGKTIENLYCSNKIPIENILVEKSTYGTSKLSKRLREENIIKYECFECGIKNIWNDKPITLHLDHINGISNDHRLNNLRFLCPNCHSQTPTYCGRNAKKFSRIKVRDNIKKKKEYFCEICNKKISSKKSKKCILCNAQSQLRTKYPPPEDLIQMIKEKGYVQIAKSLGVSDNAVRKHLKKRGYLLP